jgi:hypothetical protein
MRYSIVLILFGVVILFAATTILARAASFNELEEFQPATRNLKLIDFDTAPDGRAVTGGTDIDRTYEAFGVVFPLGNLFEDNFTQVMSRPNGWNVKIVDGQDAVFDVEILAPGITAIGVHNVALSGWMIGAQLDALSGSTLLASVRSDAVAYSLDFFGVTTTQPITHARITLVDPWGFGWGLDDLYFGKAIPEPSAAALLAFGVVIAPFVRRHAAGCVGRNGVAAG